MGFGGLCQRECLVDAKFQLSGRDPGKKIVRPLEQLLSIAPVMDQSGPGYEERAFSRESTEIKRRDRAAGLAEEGQIPARPETVEALFKSALADRIIDHVHSAAVGEFFYFRREIRLRVENNFVGAGLAYQPRLLLGGNGAEDGRAEPLRNLDQKQADAAG